MPLTYVAAWVTGDEKHALSIGLQFSPLPLKFQVFPKLKRAVWAHTNPGLLAPICARDPPKSGVTQQEQWEGTGLTTPRLCLRYIPTVFHLAKEGKKAKPGQQWFSEEAGKKQLWLPPCGAGRRSLLSAQHTKCGGPAARGASLGWQQLCRGGKDQGTGSDSLGVIYCQALLPNVLIKLQPNKCTSLRSCLCSSTAKTIEYYFQVKQEWDSRQYFYHN